MGNKSDSPDATSARALWLADKLVGDYGSEAAQLLRWYASNVPVAQTGERSQQGQQTEVAPSSAPRVAEVADATSAGGSSTAGMGEPAGQTAPKEQRTPHSLPSALPDPLSKLDGMAQGCMFMADEGVRPDEWMLREWSQKLRAIHSALSETEATAWTDLDRRDGRRLADYIEMQLASKDIVEPYHLLRLSRKECEFLRDALRSAPSATAPSGKAYEQAIRECIDSILSEYSANLIVKRAQEIANG